MNGPTGATPPMGPSAPGPTTQAGLVAEARTKLASAAKLVAEAVGILKEHVNSDEGKAALAALKALGPVTPDIAEGLGQSAIQSLMSTLEAAKPAAGAAPGGAGQPPGMLGMQRPRPQIMAGPRIPMRTT